MLEEKFPNSDLTQSTGEKIPEALSVAEEQQKKKENAEKEIKKENILNYLNENLKNLKGKDGEEFLKYIFTIDAYELLGEEAPNRNEIIEYLNNKQTEDGTWKGKNNWERSHYVPTTAQTLMIYSRWGIKPKNSLEPFFETIDTWKKTVAHVQKYDKGNFWGGLWGYITCYVSQSKTPPWKEDFLKEVNEKISEWSESSHQRTHVIASLMSLHEQLPQINEIIEKTLNEQNEDGKWSDKGWNFAIPQTFFNISLLREMRSEKDVAKDKKEEIDQAVDKGLEFIRGCYAISEQKDENNMGYFHYSGDNDSIKPIETAMGTAAICNVDLYIRWLKSLGKKIY